MSSALAAVPGIDDALAASVAERMITVEDALQTAVSTDAHMMEWTSRHLLDAGGKRIRPLLTLLAASLGDVHGEHVIDSAVLVELTHLASLYHDDVMDSAPTRRGAQSAHEVWGNSVAILTGDFLFARASSLSSTIGPRAVRWHSETFERLCIGQLHETVGVPDEIDPFEHYISVLSNKTASLIAVAGRLGAAAGGADDHVVETMARYGEEVGIAFQLADDVIDLTSDAERSGKTPGTDLREGVPTMPTLLLRKRHATNPDGRTSRIIQMLDSDLSSDRALAEVVAALQEDPAVDEAAQLAQTYAHRALTVLDDLPDGQVRDALRTFTETLVHRSR